MRHLPLLGQELVQEQLGASPKKFRLYSDWHSNFFHSKGLEAQSTQMAIDRGWQSTK